MRGDVSNHLKARQSHLLLPRLIILNNLENINAELIEMKLPQRERLIKLNNIAKKQMELLKNNKSFNNLEYIENKY